MRRTTAGQQPTSGRTFLELAGRALRWRLVLVVLVAAPMFLAGVAQLARQPDVYEGVAVLSVAPRPGEDTPSDLLRVTSERYAVILGSAGTLQRVAQLEGLDLADLRRNVEISTPAETANIVIVVRDESPARAARVANRIGAVGEAAGAPETLTTVQITSAASGEEEPVYPPRTLATALLLVLSLGAGLAAAMILERRRPRVRTLDDAERAGAAPVLGAVPRSRSAAGSLADALDDAHVGTATRALRTALLARAKARPRTFAVAGVEPGSGGTTVATLLALSLARAGILTTLFDADFRSPAVAERLASTVTRPIDVQAGGVLLALEHSVHESGKLLLVDTRSVEDASDLLSGNLDRVLREVSGRSDVVLVDVGPVGDDLAGSALTTQVDAVVLVVGRGALVRPCHTASERLSDLGVPVLGVVVNRTPRHRWRVAARAPGRSRGRSPAVESEVVDA